MRVILSGGGTGGHIYPALAVGQALRAGQGVDLLYIGVRGRMDEDIVGRAGLPFEAVRAGALRVGTPIAALRGAFALAVGTVQAWRILGRFQPDAVFATGGYASVPVGVAARARRTALLVYLPDVRPGWAVRLLARLATRIATTTDRSLQQLPAGKAEATGYPVREDFWTVDRATARQRLDLPSEGHVLLVGGASQGARRINDAVSEQLDELLDVCHVLHLTGADGEAAMRTRREALPTPLRDRYHVHGYYEDMASAMTAADLAVLRSGASVLGELPAAGLPAILVPGVYEGGYNQRANARFMEEQGAALVLENEELGGLAATVRELLADDARRTSMTAAARAIGRPDAAARIAGMVRDVALKGRAA